MNNDLNTSISELKQRVHELCIRKGWGENGVQNPQHVAMAMTVEMSELLEHFQWLNEGDVRRLMNGEDPERCAMIAEEFADVMTQTRSVFRASRMVLPGRISAAMAAEWVMPEQPMVSTRASWMTPCFTLRVSLQAPC